MKLFLISQDQNDYYETYEFAVVAAPDEESARQMNPENGKPVDDWNRSSSWCNGPEHVTVRYLGEATGDIEQGIVCASWRW